MFENCMNHYENINDSSFCQFAQAIYTLDVLHNWDFYSVDCLCVRVHE